MARAAIAAITLLAVAALVALGLWQIERRAEKHALVARIAARVHARPVPAPPPATWPAISAERSAYTRIAARGRFLGLPPALVQASTRAGPGWWVLAPFAEARGFVLLVNRGFVPRRTGIAPPPPGPVAVTGLLRVTEPGGGFLRANDPAADRWYSRDTAAIAAARRLGSVAPYFIDADAAGPPAPGLPLGGLTVLTFPDNHLVYALTWFALAGMAAAGGVIALRHRRR
ncbi:MAG: SURF1 family protein [Sphingomonas fennica]